MVVVVNNQRSRMGWFVKVFQLILFVRGNSFWGQTRA